MTESTHLRFDNETQEPRPPPRQFWSEYGVCIVSEYAFGH